MAHAKPRNIFSRYWRAYGGMRALLRSPYLWVTVILLVVTMAVWLAPNCSSPGQGPIFFPVSCSYWWDSSLSVLPNLLGFTLGGFAIFIGFGDERFRGALASKDPEQTKDTIYVRLCATFVHFIVVQVSALIFAVVAKSVNFYWAGLDSIRDVVDAANIGAGALGFGLFLYSLTLVLAATMHVFRIAAMYQMVRLADLAKSRKVKPRRLPPNRKRRSTH